MIRLRQLALAAIAFAALAVVSDRATAASATEQQVKAVFVYNFSHFVEWPPAAFAAADQPFVIGVWGSDSFAGLLEEVAKGESAGGHPIQVRRIRSAEAAGNCQILFIERDERPGLEEILAALKGRSVLTVSDRNDSARQGIMVQLVNVDNRIRVRINVDSTRAAGLTPSSNLLRSAEIVRGAAE